MAIRYSADCEVRVKWDARRRCYVGSVRDPSYRWRGTLEGPKPSRPEDYDTAAQKFIMAADKDCHRERGRGLSVEKTGRNVQIRRVFQAPCPIAR